MFALFPTTVLLIVISLLRNHSGAVLTLSLPITVSLFNSEVLVSILMGHFFLMVLSILLLIFHYFRGDAQSISAHRLSRAAAIPLQWPSRYHGRCSCSALYLVRPAPDFVRTNQQANANDPYSGVLQPCITTTVVAGLRRLASSCVTSTPGSIS